MKQAQKNSLMTFLELSADRGLLKDQATEKREEIFEVMKKIEEKIPEETKLFCQLERAVLDVLELTKYRYFEYGMLAYEIDEEYNLNYNPFERIAE